MKYFYFSCLSLYSFIILSNLPHHTLADRKPQCYFPNGSLRDSLDYVPCNSVQGKFSMCCALVNRGAVDICLENGLCAGPVIKERNTRPLWREGCSDPTWEAPECVKICMFGNWLKHDAPLTQCVDGSLCCGNGNFTCCDKGEGVFLNSLTSTESSALDSSASTSKSTSIEQASTTVIVTVSTSNPGTANTGNTALNDPVIQTPVSSSTTQPDSQPQGATTSTKIAISVGVIAGVLLIGAGVAFLIYRRRHAQPNVYQKDTRGPVELGNNTYIGGVYAKHTQLHSEPRIHTIYGGELPANYNNTDRNRRTTPDVYEMM